jgi:hypothetical protein
MRTGWQRRRRRDGSVLAAARVVVPGNTCVLGMRGAGHRKVDALVAACAAHYFGASNLRKMRCQGRMERRVQKAR